MAQVVVRITPLVVRESDDLREQTTCHNRPLTAVRQARASITDQKAVCLASLAGMGGRGGALGPSEDMAG